MLSAQENPYVKMSGKPYAVYSDTLEKITYVDVWLRNSVWVAQNAAMMREASKITKNKKWELEADFFELKYHYHYTIADGWKEFFGNIVADIVTGIVETQLITSLVVYPNPTHNQLSIRNYEC
jgi:hypothetical protein